MSQLRMLYLAEGRTPPACPALPDGYVLRPYRDGDFPGYADGRAVFTVTAF